MGTLDGGGDRRAGRDPVPPELPEGVASGRLDRPDLGRQPIGPWQRQPARGRVEVPLQAARDLKPVGQVDEAVRVDQQ
jgi:hypothetical protein